MIELPDVRKADVKGKKVFLRLDLDVPLLEVGNGKLEARISDDMRLEASLLTIEYLLRNGAKIIIAGHIGRPEGFDQRFSLEPIAEWLSQKLQTSHLKDPASHIPLRTSTMNDLEGWEISENIFLLENLRFYSEEERNDEEFAKKLASLADIYVNDAFGASHRNHASITGVPQFLPHFAGLRLQKEVEELSKVLENPARPLVVIIGGAKIETKLPLVEKMHHFANYVLIGGEIAEQDRVLLKVQHEKSERKSILLVADLNSERTDITAKSVENFLQIVNLARTVVWNGPLGKVEDERFQGGTKNFAQGLSKSSAHTIVGGGDTVSFLRKINLIDNFSFVSTGGGAMLEFLSGEKLPGLEALES